MAAGRCLRSGTVATTRSHAGTHPTRTLDWQQRYDRWVRRLVFIPSVVYRTNSFLFLRLALVMWGTVVLSLEHLTVEIWPVSFTPLCLCFSEDTLKAVGPFYLVFMPGEVKTIRGWKMKKSVVDPLTLEK